MTELGLHLANLGPALSFILIGTLALVCFVLAIKGAEWAPMMVMATVPIQRLIEAGFGSHSITMTQAVLVGFFAGALLRFANGQLSIRMDSVTVFSGALVLTYGLTILIAEDLRAWAGETYRWAVAILFLWVARSLFTGRSCRNVAFVLGGLCSAAFAWSLIQAISDDGPASFTRNGFLRVYGGFGEPNPFAAFAVAATLPTVAFAVLNRLESRKTRLLIGFAAALGIAVVLMAQSRGALMGLIAGLGLLALIWLRQSRPAALKVVVPIGLVVVSAAVVLIISAQPWDNDHVDVTSANWSSAEREAHWSAATQMIKENPLLGVGAGGFNAHFRDYTTNWHFRIPRGHAHNAYLQVASEAGLFGLLFYIGLLGAVIASIWRRLGIDSWDWMRWGVLGVTGAMMIHQLFDYLHVLSLGLLYGGLWAVALSIGHGRAEHLEYDSRA